MTRGIRPLAVPACALLVLGGLGPCALAQDEDPAHKELRALRQGVIDAFNKRDLDGMLKYVHPNAVFTWQNAEVSRGHDGIRAYYKKMLEGPSHPVQNVTANADVDELTILFGDRNGLAFGDLNQDFQLSDGKAFNLKSRWTATLVKDQDRWLIAGLHVSSDVFDNGVLNQYVRQTALWTGIAAGVGGLVLGVILYALVRSVRRPKPAVGPTP